VQEAFDEADDVRERVAVRAPRTGGELDTGTAGEQAEQEAGGGHGEAGQRDGHSRLLGALFRGGRERRRRVLAGEGEGVDPFGA
jgi:hypothetical protein